MIFFLQYKTDLIPILKVPTKTIQPNFVYVIPDDNDPKGHMVYLELTPPPDVIYKTSPGSSQQMNVLGIVIFSATMGEWDQGCKHRKFKKLIISVLTANMLVCIRNDLIISFWTPLEYCLND